MRIVDHQQGLSGLYEDVSPEVTFWVDEVSAFNGKLGRDVDKTVMHHRDDKGGATAHCGMDCVGAKA